MRHLELKDILNSWEDQDGNRYFSVGEGRAIVRDGGYGTWRVVIGIE
jgi:hypothetical protein